MHQHIRGCYESPCSEVLELVQEEGFLVVSEPELTPGYGDPGKAGGDMSGGGSYRL